jgi:hypothetical protein
MHGMRLFPRWLSLRGGQPILNSPRVADHSLGRDPGGTIGVGRKTVEHSVRGLVSLGFVGEPEPSLVTVVRLDHQQHDQARAGVGRPAARVIDSAIAFRRFVDSDEIFPPVPCLVAVVLAALDKPSRFAKHIADALLRAGGRATVEAFRVLANALVPQACQSADGRRGGLAPDRFCVLLACWDPWKFEFSSAVGRAGG